MNTGTMGSIIRRITTFIAIERYHPYHLAYSFRSDSACLTTIS